MEEKIINMNQFLGAAQGDQEHMLGKFLYDDFVCRGSCFQVCEYG